jgi:AraC family transcriptional regulator, transcriptional activator of pobA
MASMAPRRFTTITDFHRFRGLPKPEHLLISVVNVEQMKDIDADEPFSMTFDFYVIALKRNFNAKLKYGQQQYDFDEGMMTFTAPGQIIGITLNSGTKIQHSGWMILIHPDFLWGTTLATTIKQYEFFDYSVHEALFLSDKEESTITQMIHNVRQENSANIDKYSQGIIIAQLELLLTYAERFYNRQFITRKINNHQILEELEFVLNEYFSEDTLAASGLPSVNYIAQRLNVSPNYLSGLLKTLTGQSTQQHIHNKLIDRAKQQLSTTALTVSEIAYQLGFEHPQSFSKLFKTKTQLSPLEFRQSFN